MRLTAITCRLFHVGLLIALTTLVTGRAFSAGDGASWHRVTAGQDSVEIDGSRLAYAGGALVSVWSRVRLGQLQNDTDGRYNTIEALNRYDCTTGRFATLKRLYLRDELLIRAEPVLVPRDMQSTAGSPATAVLKEVCKTKPGLTVQTPETAPSNYGGSPSATDDGAFRFLKVADHTAGSVAPTAKPDPKPEETSSTTEAAAKLFINLPRIDPSQVQHPSDQPKQATTATLAEAIKSEASKAGVAVGPVQPVSVVNGSANNVSDRHAREIALATSGPRRQAARHAKPVVDAVDSESLTVGVQG